MHIHAQVLWHTHKYVHRPLIGGVHIEKLGDMCAGLARQYWLTPAISSSLPALPIHTHTGTRSLYSMTGLCTLSPTDLHPEATDN